MWTDEQRTNHRHPGGGFPSDITDAEWAVLSPSIPDTTPGGRPRKADMRSAMDAIRYLLRTDCPWRCLPCDDFPPRSTRGHIVLESQSDDTWSAIWDKLYPMLRGRGDRERSPSGGIIDSQTVRSADKGTAAARPPPARPKRRVTMQENM